VLVDDVAAPHRRIEPVERWCAGSTDVGWIVDGPPTRVVPSYYAKMARSGESQMKDTYEAPAIEDYGSIADHTFQTPGSGTKSSDTTFETDTFMEHSHPAAGS
jgi:hypothetical protein